MLHIFWSYYLVISLGWGEMGAGIALSITYGTAFLYQELYVSVWKRNFFQKFRAPLFGKQSFEDWGKLIKLAIPTTFLNCIEWWAFEFVIIFSGILGVDSLTAQVALCQVNAVIF